MISSASRNSSKNSQKCSSDNKAVCARCTSITCKSYVEFYEKCCNRKLHVKILTFCYSTFHKKYMLTEEHKKKKNKINLC